MKLPKELESFVNALPVASVETIEKAKRSINPDQIKNSLRANAINVLLSDVMRDETQTINGQSVTYGVYPVGYFDPQDGSLKGHGVVSASIFLRQVYPNNGEATNPQYICKGASDLGADGVEIASNLYKTNKALVFAEKKGMFRPTFNNVTRSMEYGNMVKRDSTFYKVTDIPAMVADQLK